MDLPVTIDTAELDSKLEQLAAALEDSRLQLVQMTGRVDSLEEKSNQPPQPEKQEIPGSFIDNTGTKDVTHAIRNHLLTGNLELLPGKYLVSGEIEMPTGRTIRSTTGNKHDVTIMLRYPRKSQTYLRLGKSCTLADVTVEMEGTPPAGQATMVGLFHAENAVVRNCDIMGPGKVQTLKGGQGRSVMPLAVFWSPHVLISGTQVLYSDFAFGCHIGYGSHHTRVEHSSFSLNGQDGLKISDSDHVVVTGSLLMRNGQTVLQDPSQVAYANGNGIDCYGLGIVIDSCQAVDNQSTGFQIKPVSYVTPWNAGLAYAEGAMVFHEGVLYKALSANTGKQPASGPPWQPVDVVQESAASVRVSNCYSAGSATANGFAIVDHAGGSYAPVDNCTFSHCIAVNNYASGFNFASVAPVPGIVYRTTVRDCASRSNGSAGVIVRSSCKQTLIDGFSSVGDGTRGVGWGVYLDGVQDCTVRDVWIDGVDSRAAHRNKLLTEEQRDQATTNTYGVLLNARSGDTLMRDVRLSNMRFKRIKHNMNYRTYADMKPVDQATFDSLVQNVVIDP